MNKEQTHTPTEEQIITALTTLIDILTKNTNIIEDHEVRLLELEGK